MFDKKIKFIKLKDERLYVVILKLEFRVWICEEIEVDKERVKREIKVGKVFKDIKLGKIEFEYILFSIFI